MYYINSVEYQTIVKGDSTWEELVELSKNI